MVKRLALAHQRAGSPLAWFEELYAAAHWDESRIPWADEALNPNYTEWAQTANLQSDGNRALVVGCGLGDEAEDLALRGFSVDAFDISPTAIEWCRKRFPESRVRYQVANLLAAPEDFHRSFSFVLEIFTIQALPWEIQTEALQSVAGFVAPTGHLLLVARGAHGGAEADPPPWPLNRERLGVLASAGLVCASYEEYLDCEDPPKPRIRALYRRP